MAAARTPGLTTLCGHPGVWPPGFSPPFSSHSPVGGSAGGSARARRMAAFNHVQPPAPNAADVVQMGTVGLLDVVESTSRRRREYIRMISTTSSQPTRPSQRPSRSAPSPLGRRRVPTGRRRDVLDVVEMPTSTGSTTSRRLDDVVEAWQAAESPVSTASRGTWLTPSGGLDDVVELARRRRTR